MTDTKHVAECPLCGLDITPEQCGSPHCGKRGDTNKAASPEREAVAVWEALKRRCASTKPGTPEWNEVTTLVQVRRSDIEAALSLPVQSVEGPVAYILGNQYRTQAGDLVRFVDIANEGTSYESMACEAGVHRYTRRDFGRVCGTAHDYSDPRNTPPLYAAPPKPSKAPAMGWKLVPVEPTDAMTYLGQSLRYTTAISIGEIYRQMIAAASTHESAD